LIALLDATALIWCRLPYAREARSGFTLCIESFQVGKHDPRDLFLDQLGMDERRRLLDDEGAPERVRLQAVGVAGSGG
jgi:hypothetical protein